jgi:hypothetical protein
LGIYLIINIKINFIIYLKNILNKNFEKYKIDDNNNNNNEEFINNNTTDFFEDNNNNNISKNFKPKNLNINLNNSIQNSQKKNY